MKKELIFILLLFFVGTIFLQAQTLDEFNNQIEKVEDANKKIGDFAEVDKSDYLKQEWNKILEKSSFGKFVLSVGLIFQGLSPVFKIFIGMEYSLSWFFFFSLLMWIFVVILIYHSLRKVLSFNIWISLGVAIIIPTIASQFGVIQKSLELFSPLLNSQSKIFFGFLILILLFILIDYLIRYFGKIMKEKIKKENEDRREFKAKTAEKISDIRSK